MNKYRCVGADGIAYLVLAHSADRVAYILYSNGIAMYPIAVTLVEESVDTEKEGIML